MYIYMYMYIYIYIFIYERSLKREEPLLCISAAARFSRFRTVCVHGEDAMEERAALNHRRNKTAKTEGSSIFMVSPKWIYIRM